MHIALIAPGFSANENDWCIPALAHLVRHLAKEHHVDVFALRYPPQRQSYRAFGARVFAFGGATRAGLGRLPLLAQALRTIIANGPYDLIQGSGPTSPVSLPRSRGASPVAARSSRLWAASSLICPISATAGDAARSTACSAVLRSPEPM
ncbi:glycosyltransferase [Candidatus Gracilibacteria bacterium]|nr:glycosyltransferase [Candidatus Gracilibacteria bacterium]